MCNSDTAALKFIHILVFDHLKTDENNMSICGTFRVCCTNKEICDGIRVFWLNVA